MFIVMNMFNIHVFQEHDEPILKHLQDIRVVFTGPDSMVDTTQYPQPTPMVCNNFTFYLINYDIIILAVWKGQFSIESEAVSLMHGSL